MSKVDTSREFVERLAREIADGRVSLVPKAAATLRALLDERDAAAQEARTLAMECEQLFAAQATARRDRAALLAMAAVMESEA